MTRADHLWLVRPPQVFDVFRVLLVAKVNRIKGYEGHSGIRLGYVGSLRNIYGGVGLVAARMPLSSMSKSSEIESTAS